MAFDASGLFGADSPKWWTIPPGEDFLARLAEGLVAWADLEARPEALADMLIYVPNRRSCLALSAALFEAAGRDALIPPEIRSLGDLETEEGPPSAEAAVAQLPAAIGAAERLSELAGRLADFHRSKGGQLYPAAALAGARELVRLLDDAALAVSDMEPLADTAEEAGQHRAAYAQRFDALEELAADSDHAVHWQLSVDCLKMLREEWPQFLADNQLLEPYVRRTHAAKAMCAHWQKHPPQGPVLVAGSAGPTPAARLLMKAAAELPQGAVVLPGLDTGCPSEAWTQIGQTPGHPQHILHSTLSQLETERAAVCVWTAPSGTARQAREALLHEALAPAEQTGDWLNRLDAISGSRPRADFVRDALSGVSVIAAADQADEACQIALLMRQGLEEGDRTMTTALVTPDPSLARRVAANLQRWGLSVPPSGGVPVQRTPAGSLVALCAEWLIDPGDPVLLMQLARHPMTRFGEGFDELERLILRGPRRWTCPQDLARRARELAEHDAAQKPYRQAMDEAGREAACGAADDFAAFARAAVLEDPDEPYCGEKFAQLVARLAHDACPDVYPWAGPEGQMAKELLETLASMGKRCGESPARLYPSALIALAAGKSAQAPGPGHPRLAIWGPLEAQLQSADRLILGGLNEDVWPAQPPVDGFLPREFRKKLGLALPETHIGTAAHGFAQLAAAPEVWLTYAKRRDGKPATASRWVWRLRTLAAGALKEEADRLLAPPPGRDPARWRRWLDRDAPTPDAEDIAPRPRPPLSARPKRLSVTRIGQLVRDPYSIYARNILGLEGLDPLGMPSSPALRGTAVHKVLEDLEKAGAQADAAAMLAALDEALRDAGETEAGRRAVSAFRHALCEWYLGWREGRCGTGKGKTEAEPELETWLEHKGQITLDIGGTAFTLSAEADRIERRGGRIAILDFKTGAPPTPKQVAAGLQPQLTLQALIAAKGGFKGIPQGDLDELFYVRFGGGDESERLKYIHPGKKYGMAAGDLVEKAERDLLKLIAAYLDPGKPLLSNVRPELEKDFRAYDRLARRSEWADDGEDGDHDD